MKTGLNTLLDIDTITFIESEIADTGCDAEYLLDPNALRVWQVTGTGETLTLDFSDDAISPDAVCLFGIDVTSNITLDVYETYPGAVTDTVTVTAANLRGLASKNIYLPVTTADIEAIKITLDTGGGAVTSSVGWIWAGEILDFDCVEKIQPFDVSNDDATVTRGNTVDINGSYLYQSFNVTLKKDAGFEELRAKVRQILDAGYATPRPYLIDEPYLTEDEVVLGILDSGKIGYDLFPVKKDSEDYTAQITIGIRETRGLTDGD